MDTVLAFWRMPAPATRDMSPLRHRTPKTAFMSGSCVAASRLGGPDLDLISFAEMFDSFNMIRGAAPDLLVLADGDHGYGNAMNVQRTVGAYGRAGAAAILIEDNITPRALTSAGKPCLPREEARMKIRAAVQAAKESGILIMARTDCRPTAGIDEAVARIEMFVAEGAEGEACRRCEGRAAGEEERRHRGEGSPDRSRHPGESRDPVVAWIPDHRPE